MDINIISPDNAQDSINKIKIIKNYNLYPIIIKGKDDGGNSPSAKDPISEYEFNTKED